MKEKILKSNSFENFGTIYKRTLVQRSIECVFVAQKCIVPSLEGMQGFSFERDTVGFVIDTEGHITRDLSKVYVFTLDELFLIDEIGDKKIEHYFNGYISNSIGFYKDGLVIQCQELSNVQKWLNDHPLPRKGISKMTRGNVYARFNGRCAYCGCEIELKEMQVDHFIAHKGQGGDDTLDNYYPACPVCNRVKSNSTIEEFKKSIRHCGEIHRKRKTPIMADSDKIAIKYGLTQEDHEIKLFFEEYNKNKKVDVKAIAEVLNNESNID